MRDRHPAVLSVGRRAAAARLPLSRPEQRLFARRHFMSCPGAPPAKSLDAESVPTPPPPDWRTAPVSAEIYEERARMRREAMEHGGIRVFRDDAESLRVAEEQVANRPWVLERDHAAVLEQLFPEGT